MKLCDEGDAFVISIHVGITCQGFDSCDLVRMVGLFRNLFVWVAPG